MFVRPPTVDLSVAVVLGRRSDGFQVSCRVNKELNSKFLEVSNLVPYFI